MRTWPTEALDEGLCTAAYRADDELAHAGPRCSVTITESWSLGAGMRSSLHAAARAPTGRASARVELQRTTCWLSGFVSVVVQAHAHPKLFIPHHLLHSWTPRALVLVINRVQMIPAPCSAAASLGGSSCPIALRAKL